MTIKEATEIIWQMDSDEYTETEKETALFEVLLWALKLSDVE